MTKKSDELTEKEENFCQEYVVDLNATQAVKRAGYTCKNDNVAGTRGWELMQIPKVKARISDIKRTREARTYVDQDKVVKELAIIAFSDVTDYINQIGGEGGPMTIKEFRRLPLEFRRAIESVKETVTKDSVTISFKLHSKIAALQMLAPHVNMVKGRFKFGADEDAEPLVIARLGEGGMSLAAWEEQVREARKHREETKVKEKAEENENDK